MKSLALAVSVAFALAGCGGSPTAPTQDSVVGTWNLKTADGAPPPFVTAQTGQDKTEITSNVLRFAAGGTFTQVTSVRVTLNGVTTAQTFRNTGEYSVNGDAVTYAIDGFSGPPFTGIVSGSTLTVGTSVYQKQV